MVEKPLDSSLASACLYTKHSQELLEYIIGTCPKDFNNRDRKIPIAPLHRKKRVTFVETFKDATAASGSKPRSNTKKDRTLPAKSDTKKVEDHSRNNKSSMKQKNHVDSSISYKRIVINSNSNSVWRVKQVKQVWQETGKLFTNVRFQWLPTGRKFTLGEQCPLTRYQHKNKQKKVISTDTPTTTVTPSIDDSVKLSVCANQQDPNGNLGSDVPNSPYSSGFKCRTVRFGNDHFGAIMGYGDYVIGDSVICRVYLGQVLRSKDETPEFVIKFLKQIQVGLNKTVKYIRTDNGTKFVNQVLTEYYESVGICHQKLVPRTPQQNGVAEAVSTACYTQNRSLIHTRHNKTPYELVHDKKPDLKFLRVFGSLFYLTNDNEDLGKLRPTTNIGIFIGYAPNRKGYRIYNKRTRKIMETIHVQFDELTEPMAPMHNSIGPEPILLSPRQISLGLIPDHVPAALYVPPTNKDLEILFQLMFDEYFEPPGVERLVPSAPAVQVLVVSAGTPSSTIINQDAPSTSYSPSSSVVQPPISHQGVAARPTIEDNPLTQVDTDPFVNVFAPEPSSDESSSGDVSSAESTQVVHPHNHLGKWSKDNPLDNVISNPSRSVSTRKQLATDALWCLYNYVLSK
ncbi:retrovirus-related pol polyprotein from transposon TNT 1-94, partial [Tanacetum coccineum]